jgi:hypothetical protein
VIFISHSSQNDDKAIAVRDWLVDQGWGLAQIYLDLESLHSGERWRQALNEIGANCEAVIACLSDDWLRSPECIREFNHAESAGKPIFPVIVEPITERIPSFITDLQFANIADPQRRPEGFERLRHGLLAARIGPEYFPWPPAGEPNRSVYRGLQALDEQDAAILFGRDAAIVDALDDMRRLRAGARVAFSPNGAYVATGSADQTARLWNGNTGASVGAIMRHDGAVVAVAFAPDGSRVLTIAADNTERQWDARTGHPLGATIHLDGARIVAGAFSPSGSLFATGAEGDAARLWDVRTVAPIGGEMHETTDRESSIYAIAFSPDGTRLATGSDGDSARLWRLQPEAIESRRDLLENTCASTLAGGISRFTPEELAAAPALDPSLDADACHPAGLWPRIVQLLSLRLFL